MCLNTPFLFYVWPARALVSTSRGGCEATLWANASCQNVDSRVIGVHRFVSYAQLEAPRADSGWHMPAALRPRPTAANQAAVIGTIVRYDTIKGQVAIGVPTFEPATAPSSRAMSHNGRKLAGWGLNCQTPMTMAGCTGCRSPFERSYTQIPVIVRHCPLAHATPAWVAPGDASVEQC